MITGLTSIKGVKSRGPVSSFAPLLIRIQIRKAIKSYMHSTSLSTLTAAHQEKPGQDHNNKLFKALHLAQYYHSYNTLLTTKHNILLHHLNVGFMLGHITNYGSRCKPTLYAPKIEMV